MQIIINNKFYSLENCLLFFFDRRSFRTAALLIVPVNDVIEGCCKAHPRKVGNDQQSSSSVYPIKHSSKDSSASPKNTYFIKCLKNCKNLKTWKISNYFSKTDIFDVVHSKENGRPCPVQR